MSLQQEILYLIKHRRSIFPPSFTEQEISRETLMRLLECAHEAPTHKLTQPWRFTVFRQSGLNKLADQLAAMYREETFPETFLQKKYEVTREKVLQSSAVIAISMHISGKIPEWEEIASVACSVQNLWLAASAMRIGGYWSTPAYISQMGNFLGLGEDEKCLGLFYMGYHQEPDREGFRDPVSEKITWIEE